MYLTSSPSSNQAHGRRKVCIDESPSRVEVDQELKVWQFQRRASGITSEHGHCILNLRLFSLSRFLARMAHTNAEMRSSENRRRQMIVELVLCIGLPCLVMSLHYIVQGHRFSIGKGRSLYPCFKLTLKSRKIRLSQLRIFGRACSLGKDSCASLRVSYNDVPKDYLHPTSPPFGTLSGLFGCVPCQPCYG